MAEQYSNETWRPVVGYEDWYSVSDHGRVKGRGRDWSHTATPRYILKPSPDSKGYPMVTLCHPRSTRKTHRLVAAAFIGPCPPGLQVNHKNGVKADNRPSNLEYVTPKENIRHAIDVLGVIYPPGGGGRK